MCQNMLIYSLKTSFFLINSINYLSLSVFLKSRLHLGVRGRGVL